MTPDIEVKIVRLNKDLPLPKYQTIGSAGMDLCASLDKDLILHEGQRALIPTGIKVQIPSGYEMQIRPRSGLALNYGISVVNSPGTIDAKGMMNYKNILCILQ